MGFVDDPRAVYQAIDLLCLPSYREGFPVSLLEAAAMGLPVVATVVPGCVDAVEDGVTGILCAARDPDALREALRTVIGDETRRRGMGQAARTRVLQHFAQEPLWKCFLSEYRAAIVHSRSRREAGTMYTKYFKRILDAGIAALAIVCLAPLALITCLAVAVRLGRPVFFRQMRPGKHGRPFEILKFRTMTDDRDSSGQFLPDAQRLTRLGRFLRASSLDELPELWNVLKGDMSLVGPRPLLIQYLDRYTPEQMRRHEVRPGITGLAQVSGRNSLEWEHKFQLDVEYVDGCSFGLDAAILGRTLLTIVRRDGISREGHATAPEFMGRQA
jgi:Sugar transferases involved in lipopolysaccharide synthesis